MKKEEKFVFHKLLSNIPRIKLNEYLNASDMVFLLLYLQKFWIFKIFEVRKNCWRKLGFTMNGNFSSWMSNNLWKILTQLILTIFVSIYYAVSQFNKHWWKKVRRKSPDNLSTPLLLRKFTAIFFWKMLIRK